MFWDSKEKKMKPGNVDKVFEGFGNTDSFP